MHQATTQRKRRFVTQHLEIIRSRLAGAVFCGVLMVMPWSTRDTAVAVPGAAGPSGAAPTVLRVCADPNNLPYSNQRLEGFENKIAELLAHSMRAELRYTWWAQRRGFLRNTLNAGACDVVMGLPVGMESVRSTRPYYRSSYVFVTRPGAAPIRSLDDPRLRRLRIGVPLVGDDGANPPPEQALARRGIVDNVAGYSVYGDYAQPEPGMDLLRALTRREIDVALAWGPPAGYFARVHREKVAITPVVGGAADQVPFAFDIAVGVRRGDQALRERLDRVLRDRRSDIERILDEFGIPRV